MKVPSPETEALAAEIVKNGGLIAFRTDTFYGLGVDPLNAGAVERLKRVKGREDNKPILLLISDEIEVRWLVQPSLLFKRVAVMHWPGPLTLIGIAQPNVPNEVTAGTGTLGLRLPDNENVRRLVRTCGGALTATSANPTGEPEARTAAEVVSYFPSGIDLIIDGGEVEVTAPSTVLDVSGEQPRLIREGAVTQAELRDVFKY
jgi:L-threonylcarbamoyladenylate synthase